KHKDGRLVQRVLHHHKGRTPKERAQRQCKLRPQSLGHERGPPLLSTAPSVRGFPPGASKKWRPGPIFGLRRVGTQTPTAWATSVVCRFRPRKSDKPNLSPL